MTHRQKKSQKNDFENLKFQGLYKETLQGEKTEWIKTKEIISEFKQDIVFGFAIILTKPINQHSENLSIDSKLSNDEKNKFDPTQLSCQAIKLLEDFFETMISIQLRYANNPHNHYTGHAYGYENDSHEEKSVTIILEIKHSFLQILQHRGCIKEDKKCVIVRISELFFSPNCPLIPKITESRIFLGLTFTKAPIPYFLYISYFNKSTDSAHVNVPVEKLGEQYKLIEKLKKPIHNIDAWNTFYDQEIYNYKFDELIINPSGGELQDQIKIYNLFEPRTTKILITVKIVVDPKENNKTSKPNSKSKIDVNNCVESVTVYQKNKKYLSDSCKETGYVNNKKVSFIEIVRRLIILYLPIESLTDIVMNYGMDMAPKLSATYLLLKSDETSQVVYDSKNSSTHKEDNHAIIKIKSTSSNKLIIRIVKFFNSIVAHKNYTFDYYTVGKHEPYEDLHEGVERTVLERSIEVQPPDYYYLDFGERLYKQYSPLKKTYLV